MIKNPTLEWNRRDLIIAIVLYAAYVALGLLTGEWGAGLGNMAPLV